MISDRVDGLNNDEFHRILQRPDDLWDWCQPLGRPIPQPLLRVQRREASVLEQSNLE